MNMIPTDWPRIVAIGETLWDLFPDAAVWGGAPGNVACHAAALGVATAMISRVGYDDYGDRGLAALAAHEVDCRFLQRDADRPTGSVQVTLSPTGDATYQFAADTAWDRLAWQPELPPLAVAVEAVCFGTLGQRSRQSRETIRWFLAAAPQAIRVFDVNLRQQFYSAELIRDSLGLATVLKLNDEELAVVAAACGLASVDPVAVAEGLMAAYGLQLVAVTRGAAGSLLVGRGQRSERAAEAATIIDTVGAGDAFTAALIVGLLESRPLEQIHDHAARLAAFVCGQRGATPTIPEQLRE
jgi:fructokinase